MCTFPDCERQTVAKGLCNAHYLQKYRYGLADLRPIAAPSRGRGMGTVYKGYIRVGGSGKRLHRAVMEESLGRGLLPTETVHHINGDRSDNRPENLELWSHSQPPGQRVQDKVKWAREILALYGGTYGA